MTQKKEFELQVLEGRPVRVYASGLVLDDDTGKIIKPAPGTVIRSPERARFARMKRTQKMQRELRRNILQEHNAVMPNAAKTAAEAYGAAGGMLYSQIILNTEAYPRDRIEAYEKLGKIADIIPDKRESPDDSRAALMNAAAGGLNAQTAATLSKLLADVQRMQEGKPIVIEGKVIDVTDK